MKLVFVFLWVDMAFLDSAKTVLKVKDEIKKDLHIYSSMDEAGYMLEQ